MSFPWPGRRPRIPRGERVYAIGDVHGRYDLLCELISLISREQATLEPARTHLIFLGDLVDRGHQSAQVLQLACRSTMVEPRAIVLKGNHEEIMVAAWRGDEEAMTGWLAHGGIETLTSFGADRSAIDPAGGQAMLRLLRDTVPADMIEWIDSLPLSYRCGDYAFVHAGIRPGIPLDRQEDADLLWIRDEFLDHEGDHGAVIVHGHTVSEAVEFRPNRIGIDTGAYHTNRLSALCLSGRERRVISTAAEPLELVTVAP